MDHAAGIDPYIVKFEQLAEDAGYDTENAAILQFFWKGLPLGLLTSCLENDATPTNWEEWKDLARRKYLNRNIIDSIIKNRVPPGAQNGRRWPFQRGQQQFRPPPGPPPRQQAVPMDVDAIHKVTEAEKKRYLAEGRCFECGKQGHMARKCPIRLKKQGQKPRPQIKVLDAPEAKEEPPATDTKAYTPQGIIEALKNMGDEEMEALRKVYCGDEDFVDA